MLPAIVGTGPSFRDFRLSSRAFFGLVLDEQFQFVGAQQASMGFVSPPDAIAPRTLLGVPFELLGFAFGSSGPSYGLSDPGVFYTWLDYDEVDGVPGTSPGEEVTHIDRMAGLQFAGPSNFSEWYFAVRPSLDADSGELWDRWSMQEAPPDLLATNYSMLNVMMMRAMFSLIGMT